jgi:PLP dependent protein
MQLKVQPKMQQYDEIKKYTDQKKVTLIAVSKLQSVEKILELYQKKHRHFGENYAQEFLEKYELLDSKKDICWHFIGQLQSNKVKFVVGKASYIHSVDSEKLCLVIDKKAAELKIRQKILLQVNLSQELAKGGLSEFSLLEILPKLSMLKNIEVVGLMTMPPLQNKPEVNEKFYLQLQALHKKIKASGIFSEAFTEISAGTTHDFHVAITCGATMIRLGTVLFGERERT